MTTPVWVLIEVTPNETQILPTPLADLPMSGGMRYRSTLCLAKIKLSPDEIRERSAHYIPRLAIGAQEIWDKFPECRTEFVADLQRNMPTGVQVIDSPLKYALAGDVRIGTRLQFFDFPLMEPMTRPPNITSEAITVPNSALGRFSFVSQPEPFVATSVLDKYLYLCDNFSIVGTNGNEIAPRIRFLTPRALFNGTDFAALINAKNQPPPNFPANMAHHFQGPKVPARISGAFLIKMAPGEKPYADALVGRILAAAAISGTAYGKVPMVLQLTASGFSTHGGDQYAGRPYTERDKDYYSISIQDALLSSVLSLIKGTNQQKFANAKEDFRLLALDTIEDSRRSGVPVLEFAQIWMAIERLIPFKTETTAQLALALSAFSPIGQRDEHFKELKKSYGLRSQIVHGYSFARAKPVSFHGARMAEIFRRLFAASLTVQNSDELKERLISHVLSGAENPFDNST